MRLILALLLLIPLAGCPQPEQAPTKVKAGEVIHGKKTVAHSLGQLERRVALLEQTAKTLTRPKPPLTKKKKVKAAPDAAAPDASTPDAGANSSPAGDRAPAPATVASEPAAAPGNVVRPDRCACPSGPKAMS